MSFTRTSRAHVGHVVVSALALALAGVALVPAQVFGQQGPAATDLNSWVAPERASKRTSPTPSNAGTVKHGRDLYTRECLKCHGKAGQGDGPQAAYLEVRPRDLTSATVANQSDGALFWKITEGFGPMPKANLNDNDKWAVIDYVRTLAKKP